GLNEVTVPGMGEGDDKNAIRAALGRPTPDRLLVIAQALRLGVDHEQVRASCSYDPWFIEQLQEIVDAEAAVRQNGLPKTKADMRALRARGFSDARLAELCGMDEEAVRKARRDLGVRPVYKRIDTCAAEFESLTPYMYSTYETDFAGNADCEAEPSDRMKAIILGGGPNRIGQANEVACCSGHAAFALEEIGIESIMVNCTPETVSTDYDTSARLYFDPLTAEDVLELIDLQRSKGTLAGVIVQFAGQTPPKLAHEREPADEPTI